MLGIYSTRHLKVPCITSFIGKIPSTTWNMLPVSSWWSLPWSRAWNIQTTVGSTQGDMPCQHLLLLSNTHGQGESVHESCVLVEVQMALLCFLGYLITKNPSSKHCYSWWLTFALPAASYQPAEVAIMIVVPPFTIIIDSLYLHHMQRSSLSYSWFPCVSTYWEEPALTLRYR